MDSDTFWGQSPSDLPLGWMYRAREKGRNPVLTGAALGPGCTEPKSGKEMRLGAQMVQKAGQCWLATDSDQYEPGVVLSTIHLHLIEPS